MGEALLFNGGRTYDSEKAIVEYSWDFDNDHIIDVVSDSPRVVWRYDQAYTGFVTIFVKASDGGVSSATKNIKIDALSVEEEPAPVEEDIPEVEEPEVVSEPEVTVINEPSNNSNSGTSGATNTSNNGNNTNSNQVAQGVEQDIRNNFTAILGEENGQNTKKKEVRGAVDNFVSKYLASLPNVEQTQSKNKILIGLLAVALLGIVAGGVIARRKLKQP